MIGLCRTLPARICVLAVLILLHTGGSHSRSLFHLWGDEGTGAATAATSTHSISTSSSLQQQQQQQQQQRIIRVPAYLAHHFDQSASASAADDDFDWGLDGGVAHSAFAPAAFTSPGRSSGSSSGSVESGGDAAAAAARRLLQDDGAGGGGGELIDPTMEAALKKLATTVKDKIPKNISELTGGKSLADIMPRNASEWRKRFWPENTTLKGVLKNITLQDGVSLFEFAKALVVGTISSNTADTNTPDRGLSDVQSGAININPFLDGAALANALTLAGRDATANARGIVFGMVGTGRASSQATALGVTGAKSKVDTFTINGGGLSQNAMSSNLGVAPLGAADTAVRAAAFDIAGATATGGLTNALGKKAATASGLGAGMTGLGDSYSSQFANALSLGDAASKTGVIAGTLTGAAKSTVGSLATSVKNSADAEALTTANSALGSATSKSASAANGARNATSHSGAVAKSAVGNTASVSSTSAAGLDADASAESKATTKAGAANSVSIARATGVNSAKASGNATSEPSTSGLRSTPVLWTQRKLPSTTFTRSTSSSSSRAGGAGSRWLPKGVESLLPGFVTLPPARPDGLVDLVVPATTGPLLGEALISAAGLKALLPSVPKIVPQPPTLNQTVTIENAAPPCNETEINANRTANETRLTCNATAPANVSKSQLPADISKLPGMSLFETMRQQSRDFVDQHSKDSRDARASNATKAAAAANDAATAAAKAAKAAAGSGGGSKPASSASGGKPSSGGSASGGKPAGAPAAAAAAAKPKPVRRRWLAFL